MQPIQLCLLWDIWRGTKQCRQEEGGNPEDSNKTKKKLGVRIQIYEIDINIFTFGRKQFIVYVSKKSKLNVVMGNFVDKYIIIIFIIFRMTSVKSSIDIITHEGSISQVSADAELLSDSVNEWDHHFLSVWWHLKCQKSGMILK